MRTVTFKNPIERAKKISEAKKGIPLTTTQKLKLSEARKRFYKNGGIHPRGMAGKPQSVKQKEAILKAIIGPSNHSWKGEKVSYGSLHQWVRRWLGKPNKCESCGKIGYGREMHWANKDHQYKRNLTDWLRLCRKCHVEYDRKLTVAK